EVLAGAGVGEDGQAVAVQRHPLGEVAEVVAWHRQLAASARVRADRTGMEMTHRNSELRLGGSSEGLCARQVLGVEVNVRVEIANRGLGHWAMPTRCGRAFPAGCTWRRPA